MMKALRVFLALPVLGLLAGAPARAAAGEPAVKSGGDHEVEAVKNVAYFEGKDADNVRHKLDLYVPKGPKGFPVLVFVHGGAWQKGNKAGFEKLARLFARNGVGTAVTNYRLSPDVRHPVHTQDVAKAVAWVHRNIAKYGGRPDEIFLSGHSAGGHIVALLGADPSYLKAAGVPEKDIRGVIPISGVFTIRAAQMPKVFGTSEEDARSASPMAHIKGNHPPFLILVADRDLKGFDRMAEAFGKALGKVECKAQVITAKDRDHGTIVMQMRNQADPCTQAVLAFIAQHSHLKLREVSSPKAGS
jgi:acetyl esterase/lipase